MGLARGVILAVGIKMCPHMSRKYDGGEISKRCCRSEILGCPS